MQARASQLLPIATAATYCLPWAFPDPALAQYIMRGWLGCLCALALWRGWRITAAAALCIVVWEGATSMCGAYFADLAPAAEGLCDKGTGLPWTWPSLAITVLAVMFEGRSSRGA